MEEGQRISWRTINGTASGIISGFTPKGYMVRLDKGKFVIVHPKSIINEKAH